MTSPSMLPVRSDWEPKQTIFNLLLQYPDFELRALAQIYTNTVDKATLWLAYPYDYKAYLGSIYTPNSGPSVYVPYLDAYARCILNQTDPIMDLSVLNVVVMDRMVADFNPRAPYGPSTENASIMMSYVTEREQQAGTYELPTLYVMPAGNFRIDPDIFRFSKPKQWLVGMGRNGITTIHCEPSTAGNNRLFTLNSDDNPYTTLVGCRFLNFSIRGYNPDVIGPTDAANRHRKVAFYSVCTSEPHFDVDIFNFNTGSANYGSEGGSEGLDYRGKELAKIINPTWITDIPVHCRLNPKESGNQIDCDVMKISDSYFIGTDGANAEYLLKFDSGLNIKRFKMTGNNIWAAGKGSIELVETTGGVDALGFEIESLSHELAVASTAPCLRIVKNGSSRMFDLHIRKYLPSFSAAGIELSGVRYSSIEGGGYYQFAGQSVSKKALTLGSGIRSLRVAGFMVPSLPSNGGANLLSLGTATKTFTTGDAVAGGTNASGESLNQLDSLVIFDSP